MVVASLVKEFQLASELNHMKGIVPDDILEALKKKKLGLPGIDIEAPVEKNAMMAGEFEVIMELLAAYSEGDQGKIAKAQVKYFSRFMPLSYYNFYIFFEKIMVLTLSEMKLCFIG